MRRFSLWVSLLIFLAGGFLGSCAQAQKKNIGAWKRSDTLSFRYPMDIPPEISGSFAELRATHFHGGMDFRTQQREGIKVYGIAPGRIIRAEVSRTGYGKALYVQHEDGLISLYAHLSKFGMGLEGRIRKAQRQSRNTEVRLDNLHIKVPPKRPIALSGNTGSSGGPHLHLEMRRDTLRLNPACFGLEISDSIPPILYYMAVYQSSRTHTPSLSFALPPKDAFVDSCMKEVRMDAPAYDRAMYQALEGIYEDFLYEADTASFKRLSPRNTQEPAFCMDLPADSLLPFGPDAVSAYYETEALPDTLWVNGTCAFGLCTLDSIQYMPFHYGLYELAVLVREETAEPAFASDFDTLAFYRLSEVSNALYSNIRQHIDPLFYVKTRKRLEKAWVMPQKGATPYSVLRNNGVLNPLPGSFYRLRIIARDFAKNESVLERVIAKD